MDHDLVDPFRDFVQLFERLEVRYVLIGGLAVSAFGIPRPTHDLDFTLAMDRSRLPELFAESEKLGYSVSEEFAKGWVDQVAGMSLIRVQLWLRGKVIDVDLFLSESRFQESMIQRGIRLEVDGIPAWVASPEDLTLLKLVAGRPRDIGDILDIRLAQGELDRQYLSHWAGELGVSEKLSDVMSIPME